jgi:hypothetical protein
MSGNVEAVEGEKRTKGGCERRDVSLLGQQSLELHSSRLSAAGARDSKGTDWEVVEGRFLGC